MKNMKMTICLMAALFSTAYAGVGTWTTVDKPGATRTMIYDIDGSNLVGAYNDASGSHGFIYNGTSWTTLDFPGAQNTYSQGISGSSVVGYYENPFGYHGFIYNGTSWTTLDFPGAQNTYAQDISGSSVVGYYNGAGAYHGFIYNGTSWTTLDCPEAQNTYSQGISGSSVVGYYENPFGYHGFIYCTIPEPTPPIANAGSGHTVTDSDDNGSEQVILDGSGSSDSDGTILSWVWTDNLGDTIPDGEIITATLSVGTHTITLTVTDNDGLTDSDIVTVTVEPRPSFPPDANANGPYTIQIDDTLTLDASGSTDNDNDIVSYMWDLDDNGSFETDAGNQEIFDVNYAYLQSLGLLVDNTYNIHLKVTDSKNQSDTASSALTIIPTPALQVAVDIKPGSCPNPLNVKSSGVLSVAILGTNDVNVITIDPTSIRLAGVKPLRSGLEDVAGSVADGNDCNCSEAGPDGFLDLTLKFKTQEVAEAIGDVNDGDVLVLELTGVLFNESPIEGADCVLILDKHKPFNKADFNHDGRVDMADFAAFAENWLQSSIVED